METIRAFRDDRLASGTFVSERPGRKVCLLHNGTLAQYNIQSLWYHSTTSLRKELSRLFLNLGLFSLFLSTGRNVSLDSVGAVDELVIFHKLIYYIISRVA